jgi:DnaK suppressor protein
LQSFRQALSQIKMISHSWPENQFFHRLRRPRSNGESALNHLFQPLFAGPPQRDANVKTHMSNLTQDQLDQLSGLLDQREATLRADVRRETDLQDDYAQVASEAPDPGDASFADLSVDLNNAAVTRDIVELRAIEAARKRMDAGTYGECAECGLDIPFERLKAQLTAERCAPCQEIFEKTHSDASKGGTL